MQYVSGPLQLQGVQLLLLKRDMDWNIVLQGTKSIHHITESTTLM